jgi:hypothetical protein
MRGCLKSRDEATGRNSDTTMQALDLHGSLWFAANIQLNGSGLTTLHSIPEAQ